MSSTAIAPRLLASVRGGGAAAQALCALPVAAVAGGLTVYAASRSAHGLLFGLVAVLVVAGVLWFATTSKVQLALALVMLYIGLLDGYLKLSTGSSVVTFVRDVLLWAIVAGELVRAAVRQKRLSLPPLGIWVIWFVAFVLVQLFNPQDGSLTHSLAGMRQHLEFVPLFFLAYAYVRTVKALRTFVILLVFLAVANAAVNLVQLHETPQQFAAWGPGYAQRIIGTGGFTAAGREFFDASGQTHTRPFGLMSDEGAGGLVAAFALGGFIALASLRRQRRYLLLVALGTAVSIAGIVASQGRAVIVCSLAVVLTYLAVTATSRGRVKTILGVALLAAIAYLSISTVLTGTQSRYAGVNASQILQTTQQARGVSIARIPKNIVEHPLGVGLGVAGPAAGVSGAPALSGIVDAETEFSFATVELGIPGMLAIVGFTVALLVLAVRRCRNEPDSEARVLLAAVLAPVGGMLVIYIASAITPTTPSGPYLWTAGGIASYWLVTRQAALRQAARSTL